MGKTYRHALVTVDGKKVVAHRYIMERHLGRKLLADEHVHHINKNSLDNRIENLVVMNVLDHERLHHLKHPLEKVCEVCGHIYRPNADHRGRQKCCSPECAYTMRKTNMAKSRGYAGW